MTDEPDSLILRQLRRSDAKLDRILEDLSDTDIKGRLSRTEEALVALTHRIDRMDGRLDRVEHRLDLVGEA